MPEILLVSEVAEEHSHLIKQLEVGRRARDLAANPGARLYSGFAVVRHLR